MIFKRPNNPDGAGYVSGFLSDDPRGYVGDYVGLGIIRDGELVYRSDGRVYTDLDDIIDPASGSFTTDFVNQSS